MTEQTSSKPVGEKKHVEHRAAERKNDEEKNAEPGDKTLVNTSIVHMRILISVFF